MTARLCLNMIVKNETANLLRCLRSVRDHLSCWIIGDTGSTDGTQDMIREFFAEHGIPGELHSFPFDNFEQARNDALDRAYASTLTFDYLLLTDADMELVVEDTSFRDRLQAPGYRVIQRSSLSYWNTRLIRRDASARYHGVTHEFLDVPGGVEILHGVWYRDHASGANRVDKFERDIRLLSEGLRKEPDNHRYWFYLAQSQRDAGLHEEAAATYEKRAEMGGWEEEAWYARLQQARCLLTLKNEAGFLRQALIAFNQRPHRAEPLYDLARYYREHGMNDASMLFCEAGLAVPRPTDDILFVEDLVYDTGLLEEYSIVANYAKDPARKDRGHAACEYLALYRDVPQGSRELARANLRFYMQPASVMMPSFTAHTIAFTPPEGYRAMNPSVARCGERLLLIQRTVNYWFTEDHAYATPNDAPIRTRNFLLHLNTDLAVEGSAEILPPTDVPPPRSRLIEGFEDMRLFQWLGGLWCSTSIRELTEEAWCQQVLARLDPRDNGSYVLTDWRSLSPGGKHEKNWMPQVEHDRLRFIYSCDPTRIVNEHGEPISETDALIAADWFRGGSQAIKFDGGWLALVHEVSAAAEQRFYAHRFVWFDAFDHLQKTSRRFFFQAKGIEFAAGIAWHPDDTRLVISFGVGDCESWIATVDPSDVRRLLHGLDRLNKETRAPMYSDVRRTVDQSRNMPSKELNAGPDGAVSIDQFYQDLAPFLQLADSPDQRRIQSRAFDARIQSYLGAKNVNNLPLIHCFYEVLSAQSDHRTLIAAIASMRHAGHRVQIWTYTPEKLRFLTPMGVELCEATDVVPRSLFEQILARAEIRYFSDVFRYAVLYEHGGLWLDSDVILLRPFAFHGDYFFNLQWRGGHVGHFVCGNVIYARPYSQHLRNLYEISVEQFFGGQARSFGEIGPKLLSDYIASPAGTELANWVFSPMFFNTIDWTELDHFDRPLHSLADCLNDDRVIGVHLWTNRTRQKPLMADASLTSLLADPVANLPTLEKLADRFDTDKNRVTGNHHYYSRIYDRLLASHRFSMRRLMEIGLCRGLAEQNQHSTPSVELWQTYFPFCQVIGIDLTDFSRFNNERFVSIVCNQSKRDDLRSVAERIERGSVDVIIDDGSHVSFDQQMTFREFFPLLVDGGWYFIEDLDWQPPGEDAAIVPLTKHLFKEMQQYGSVRSLDPLGISELSAQISDVLFFDSHYELQRAILLGGLLAVRKRGGSAFG